MDDKKVVQESLLEVFRLNGWSQLSSMTQRDFEHISIELQKKSGIVISGITIKRLANGSFSRMPQIATLNAIANYFDFKTWQEYKASVNRNEKNADTPKNASPVKKRKLTLPAMLGLVLLAVILTGLYFLPQKWQGSGFETASFSAHKTTGKDIPNTVVFNYNIDDVQADSFFIQQSWDKNRRVRIYKNTHTLTDIYYEPGYHIAKLIANDSIIKAVPVSVPTRDWIFYANENKVKYQTEYIKADKPVNNGVLALSPLDLTKNRIAPEKGKLYLYSYFPLKQEVSSENFSLKTRVRMKEISNNFCPYIAIEVYAQRYFMLVKSTPKGCAAEAFFFLGQKKISGKDTDLSAISFDVTQWTDIELTVKNKQATVKINGKESFSSSYKNDTNLITGLSFISNGLCEVDNVELKGLDGKVVYENDF
jgi:transcriptional regulator with XRE-family HTH domain